MNLSSEVSEIKDGLCVYFFVFFCFVCLFVTELHLFMIVRIPVKEIDTF